MEGLFTASMLVRATEGPLFAGLPVGKGFRVLGLGFRVV